MPEPSFSWENLDYWTTGEWQVVQENLDDLDKAKIVYNPRRENLFRALDLTPFDTVKVVILGQDPYPNHQLATGLAFSVPSNTKIYPPTLVNILSEVVSDLRLPAEKTLSGNLDGWAKQGVLLWNVIPSCLGGRTLSHNWEEWKPLTQEIIERLSKEGIVFALWGNKAKEYIKFIDDETNEVITSSHPSPLGVKSSRANNFLGSRMFSTINDKLVGLGKTAIDWRT